MQRKYRKGIASKEYRALSSAPQRACLLLQKYGLPRRFILAKKVCTQSEWKRMLLAVKNNRQIGIRGRPPKVSKETKQKIKNAIMKRVTTSRPMTAREIKTMVSNYSVQKYFILSLFKGGRFSPFLSSRVQPTKDTAQNLWVCIY